MSEVGDGHGTPILSMSCLLIPHCVTGYSPFELMFGRNVKGPLNPMTENWLSGEVETGTLCEWLTDLKAKMAEMAKIVTSREVQAKSDMKHFYDRSARKKVFDPGDMVLVRRSALHSKLSDA